MKSPFLTFEDDFHVLFAAVEESTGKLSPSSAGTVAALSTAALLESFLRFCEHQRDILGKLRPALMKARGVQELAAGAEINISYRQLVGKNILSVKEEARIRSLAGAPQKDITIKAWRDTSQFLFDVAVIIARETAIAAKRGLDPKRKAHAKTISALDRLLVARYDTLA